MKKIKRVKARAKFDGAAPLPIILYLLSVCTALMYTICRSQFLPSVLAMSALTAGIFMLFYKLRFRPLATTLCIFSLIVAAWLAGSAASAWYPTADSSFVNFLFSASAEFDLIYASAAVFVFALVIGFIGCYFSVISPRPCFLMLLMFIPMILSSRTSRELPVYFMLTMTGCFIFASANLSIPCPPDNMASFEEKGTRRRRVAISCAVAALLTLIVAVLPKNTETPLQSYLDSFVPKNTGGFYNSGLTNFTNHSSVNYGMNNPKDKLLFTVETDSPGILMSWGFDIRGESGWVICSADGYDFDTGYSNWETDADYRSAAKLIQILKENEEALSEESRAILEGITAEEPRKSFMTISIQDGSATRVVMHPNGTIKAYLPEKCGRNYLNPRGEIFTEFAFPVNATYSLRHYTNSENAEFLRRLDNDSFEALINDAMDSWILSWDEGYALLDEIEDAERYMRAVGNTGITPRIQQLADEITEGIVSDYDKARAIEQWFGEAGFVYDLEFVPEERSTEYFLFESRRGICSDYADAMTLLARAAGIPARYCEGYAIPESAYDEQTGLYNVTDAQAHAYTQIYFPGGGWIDFDGTRYAVQAGEEAETVPAGIFILIGAAAAALLIFVFRKPLSWLWFNITYPIRSKAGKIRGVYVYTRRLAARLSGMEENNLSCGEVRDILSARLSMPQEAERICSAADELFYSPGKTTECDPKLLKYLKALKKRRRRLKK